MISLEKLTKSFRIIIILMAFCVGIFMLLAVLDSMMYGVANWNLLVIFAEVSIIAFAAVRLIEKKINVDDYTQNWAIQSSIGIVVAATLTVLYAYFWMEEPRWQVYQGGLIVPLIMTLAAMMFYKKPV